MFLTVSGSHLYGFPSADSDFDLRGSHLLPGEALWGLDLPRETVEPKVETEAGLVEIVSHDLRKFVRLLLKRNGYVLEQLTSPLVIRTTPLHAELLRLVPGVLTKNHYYHYRGFYHTERREYDRSEPRSVKKLLYAYRVLMTGCVLLREGVVEANLPRLKSGSGFRFWTSWSRSRRPGSGSGFRTTAATSRNWRSWRRRWTAPSRNRSCRRCRPFAPSWTGSSFWHRRAGSTG